MSGAHANLDLSPHVRPAAYVTAGLPGIGGILRQRAEDFIVEEIPAYEPCGSGEHIYLFVQKRDLSTLQMVKIIAKHFGVRMGDVGYAGLKDKRALTRQVVSIHTPGKKPEDFPEIRHERLAVLWADLHTNKLRRGHLKGNRFSIRVRGVPISAAFTAQKALRRLAAAGVPNRAGAQRFGKLLNNHLVGRAMILGEARRALDELLGPAELRDPAGLPDPPLQVEGRRLYAQGRCAEALDLLPPGADAERAALRALARGATPEEAVASIDPVSRLFYLNGLQSAVFNAVLDERMAAGALDRLVEGDLAFKHDNGAAFAVDALTLADPHLNERLTKLEVSPSGPVWAGGMMRAGGAVGAAEERALARVGLTPEHLSDYVARSRDELRGARRPLRVPLTYPEVEAGSDEHGLYVRCSFELPAGAFATTVMDEVMKVDAVLEEE